MPEMKLAGQIFVCPASFAVDNRAITQLVLLSIIKLFPLL